MMAKRLGRTSLYLSQLGFGCGSIGGLLVRGDYPTMRQVVARALELGINYFDTAPMYGNGQSEANLGAVWRELRADASIGTKVRVAGADLHRIPAAIVESVDRSLRRLGVDTIDLFQLHNRLDTPSPGSERQLGVSDLESVARTFEALRQQGKIRYWGMTGLGTSDALQTAVATGAFQSIQVPYNLLNPSAGMALPQGLPFQDYGRLIDQAGQQAMGVIAIRILAGGALAGTTERHPTASRTVDPIASAPEYEADVARARQFAFLVDEGVVETLVEAAMRFVISKREVTTALVGISSLDQLEQAVRYVERGPLSEDVLARIGEI